MQVSGSWLASTSSILLFERLAVSMTLPFSLPAWRSAAVLSERPPFFFSPMWQSPQCVLRMGAMRWAKSTGAAARSAVGARIRLSAERVLLFMGALFRVKPWVSGIH